MLPKHISPEQDAPAIAPYNFVSLPDQILTLPISEIPDHDIYKERYLSGFIKCELLTSSPLFIRAGHKLTGYDDEGDSNSEIRDFWYVLNNNKPEIPGSSLRGMFRSLYEIITFSGMHFVTDQKLIYRAVGDPTSHGINYRDRLFDEDKELRKEEEKRGNNRFFLTPRFKAGYIHQNPRTHDWYIQPAREVNGASFAIIWATSQSFQDLKKHGKTRNCKEIFVEVSELNYQKFREDFINVKYLKVKRWASTNKDGLIKAVLIRSGRMFSKKFETVVFEEDFSKEKLLLSDDQVQVYRDQITKEQDKLLGENGILTEGHPVFYLLDNDDQIEFFGHCRMFRIPYKYSPKDLITNLPNDPHRVDFAQALFGYIPSNRPENTQTLKIKNEAFASRIVFENGYMEDTGKPIWCESVKDLFIQTQNEPRPTTFQHYLTQSSPDSVVKGKPNTKKLMNYDDKHHTTLRGAKFYWHKNNRSTNDVKLENPGSVKSTQRTVIRPLNEGLKFSFVIRFNNLRHEEMGALLWLLRVGSDPNYRFSLGMGKPLGFGAVAINSECFQIKRKERYQVFLEKTNQSDKPTKIEEESTFQMAKAELISEEKINVYIDKFESFINESFGNNGEKGIRNLPRMQEFLTLLSWPGPDKSLTRYQEIDHFNPNKKNNKENEYATRPVLPLATDFGIKILEKEQEYLEGEVLEFGLGSSKSYGYILPDDRAYDRLFVHKNHLENKNIALKTGQRVRFKIIPGDKKGIQADDVSII